jgi:hypothetical protein
LRFRALEHDQLPFCLWLVKAKDIEAAVGTSDFEVAIIAAGPLIERFDSLNFASV